MEETYATSFPAYIRICTVPDAVSLPSVEKYFQHQGHATQFIPKPKGDHLNECELQIWIQGRSATFGISDWDGNARTGERHAYVRGSHKILHIAASIFKDAISPNDDIDQKEKLCKKPCETKYEDCGGYCDYYASEKHDTHQCDTCNPWKHLQ